MALGVVHGYLGEAAEAECAWLEEHVYGGRPGRWRRETLDVRSRYSGVG